MSLSNPWKSILRALLLGLCLASPAHAGATADAATARADVIRTFCARARHADALQQLVALGTRGQASERDWARTVLTAVRDGALSCGPDSQARIARSGGSVDAVTMRDAAAFAATSPYVPTIVMMRRLAVALAEIDLFSDDASLRLQGARKVAQFFALLDPKVVERALQAPGAAAMRDELELAMARRGLSSSDPKQRLDAVETLAGAPSEISRTLLRDLLADPATKADPPLAGAARSALRSIDARLGVGKALSVLFSGLSYAGILLLTAVGLSIIFGLMGVINLAHGEFIMLGAYTTYLVERGLQTYAPGWFNLYVLLAIPVAFVACAGFGVALEFLVIRFLYRRPLETLLATWAVSIATVKAVQLVFGSQNLEFIPPAFLNGGLQVMPGLFVTYNRLFAIGFSALVFATTFAVLRTTRIGLLMRATTQNRSMARCLGIAAHRVDRLAFAMGAGLAGLAGVMLTQIASVNPFMGSSFVIDAFMVVVLGGAGSLAGTAVSSLALGEVNQLIEPFYGAVAAKVAVLLLIVLIIQRRPNGLFTVKVRG